MPKPEGAPRFKGFSAPHYTQTPDDLFDWLLPDLSGAELKVLLYIVRRTFGFKKDADTIGIKQLMEGITTADGRQLDRGTGLGRSTVLAAVKSLEDWGLIERQENTTSARGDLPSTYRLCLDAQRGSSPLDRGGPEISPRGVHPAGRGRSSRVDPQETVSQQTAQQTEDVSKSAKNSPANGATGAAPAAPGEAPDDDAAFARRYASMRGVGAAEAARLAAGLTGADGRLDRTRFMNAITPSQGRRPSSR